MEPADGVNKRSRTAATEEDVLDHIGFDTPRSGVATPQPDPHDRRLPGIMSYFGQVRSVSFQSLLPRTEATTKETGNMSLVTTLIPRQLREKGNRLSAPVIPIDPVSVNDSGDNGFVVLKPSETAGPVTDAPAVEEVQLKNPCTALPASQHAPSVCLKLNAPKWEMERTVPPSSATGLSLHKKSVSEGRQFKARSASLKASLTVVTTSTVHASHFSNPGSRAASVHNSPTRLNFSQEDGGAVDHLKRLTSGGIKSGPPTPTRALSTAQPSVTEDAPAGNGSVSSNGTMTDRSGTKTPTPPGGQAKGRLTIKIAKGRGLRKSRDPYVVAVFQRSELISGSAHSFEDEDEASIAAVAMGGVPIQRQGSDSGRPPMAIPMRSRQSSNTSISDYATFRNRQTRRSFSSPEWDAEAIL